MKTLIIFRLWGSWPYHCTSSNSPGILYELSFSMSFVDSRSEDQTREKGNQPLSERVIDHSGSFGETWRVDVLQGPPLGQKCHHLDTILSCFPFAHLLSHLCAHEWGGITVWDEGLQLNICKVPAGYPYVGFYCPRHDNIPVTRQQWKSAVLHTHFESCNNLVS